MWPIVYETSLYSLSPRIVPSYADKYGDAVVLIEQDCDDSWIFLSVLLVVIPY